MNRFALMPAEDRRVVLAEAGERLQIQPVVLEKDFWVCWMLGLLFGQPKWGDALVFKGGTALSKVFGIIRRFSEDIDLSVSPAALGLSESEVEQAASRRQRDQWMENLEAACRQWVRQQLQPELERSIKAVLGVRPQDKDWLEFETDANTHSPMLLFYYPSALAPGADYIRRWVKLEFGSLTDQRPTGVHRVRPWVANILPSPLAEMGCDLVALEAERAFWEKVSPVGQNAPGMGGIERFKVHHFWDAKTTPFDRRLRAVGMGHVERPEIEPPRSSPQFTREEMVPPAHCA